jgi:hypothetical protein
VDSKRKKEAKKENIVIVVVYNKLKNTNLKDRNQGGEQQMRKNKNGS